MNLLGTIVCIFACTALWSLADAEIESTLYYTLLVFIQAFIGFCIVSIQILHDRVKKLEKAIIKNN